MSVKQLIDIHNVEQKIHNENRYGPVTQDTIFITIQVHNRIEYLRYLIDSFRNAEKIENALLIFSHDVYDFEINDLIQSIDFAMVLQIFYPFSIQAYPNVFPGTDPRDCPRDMNRITADEINCLNAAHPDTYGHYREAKFTQMKHHWWWKLNRIFDNLQVTRNIENFQLLLMEEDYYVAPDFLYVYKQMLKLVPLECPQCNIISLGTYAEHLDADTYNIIDISPWTTNLHNMGMSFNKSTWVKVRNCARHFCNYDEYNYDFSLQNINRKCLKEKLFTALIRGPRVYHVGECGIHHSNVNCHVSETIQQVDLMLQEAHKEGTLYPEDLEVGEIDLLHPTTILINNGGWADKRDQCLCLDMTTNVRNEECHLLYPSPNGLNAS